MWGPVLWSPVESLSCLRHLCHAANKHGAKGNRWTDFKPGIQIPDIIWYSCSCCYHVQFSHTDEQRFFLFCRVHHLKGNVTVSALPSRSSWSLSCLRLSQSFWNTAWQQRDAGSGCCMMTSSRICSLRGPSNRVGSLRSTCISNQKKSCSVFVQCCILAESRAACIMWLFCLT